jgi:hypothetical protein
MSDASPLHLDVHVAPMRPMQGAPPQGPGDESMWSPMSATLIHGRQNAVLVDTLVTFAKRRRAPNRLVTTERPGHPIDVARCVYRPADGRLGSHVFLPAC